MKYVGSCHCGRVRFEIDGTIDSALACNCSICSRKGSLLWFTPRSHFTLLTPESAAAEYTFHRHRIHHRFCPDCGLHPYAEAKDPQGRDMVAVNLRCVEGPDLDAIPLRHFDGRSV